MTWDVLRWVVGGLLMGFGVLVPLSFWAAVLRLKRDKDRSVSGIPLFGTGAFLIGWLVSPLSWTWWALLFLIADFHTPLTLAYLPYLLWTERGSKRQ